MPVNTRSRGYKKKPAVEPAGSPGSKPLEPGVYLPPEESLPDFSPSEATPSVASLPALTKPSGPSPLQVAAEKRQHRTQVANNLLNAPLPSLTKPLNASTAVKALEEQGTPPAMATRLAQKPEVVEQLEIALKEGFGNTPHPTESNPSPASTAVISSNPKSKAHQDLLSAAKQKVAHPDHVINQMKQGLQPAEAALLPYVLRAHKKYPDIPVSVMMAQIKQESGFNPAAVSSAGAFGATQFIPSTAESYGVEQGTGPKEIESQVMGQAALLHDDDFANDPEGALSAYSGGYAEGEYNNPILEDAKQNYSHLDELAGDVTGAIPTGIEASGPVPVPNKARKEYFENEGAHLRFIPTFAHHLEKLAKLSGEPVKVNEGFRSEKEQAHLYQLYENGEGNLAAPPGESEHEKGLAADAELTPHQRELLSAAGLDLPVAGEDWHVQLSEPQAIEQADQELEGSSGVSTFDPSLLPPSGGPSSFVGAPSYTPETIDTSAQTGAELLAQHKQKASTPDDSSNSALQLLFGGAEGETPTNALLNSPLPSFGSAGTSTELSNEELLKLLLERA